MAECFAALPASALSRLSLTAEKSSCNASETEYYQDSLFGTMSEPLMESLGEDSLTASARDSHARALVQPEPTAATTASLWELMVEARSYGRRFQGLLSNAGIQCSLLRIPEISLTRDFAESFTSLRPLGMTVNGVCLGLATSMPTMNESVCGSRLPTPTAHNSKEGAYPAEYTRNTPTLAAQIGGKINPDWNEWRMGWPIKWTDLEPLEMDRFQSWKTLHSMPLTPEL